MSMRFDGNGREVSHPIFQSHPSLSMDNHLSLLLQT